MKWITKLCVCGLVLCATVNQVTAQRKSGFDWSKVVYGGSIMPVFSNMGTNISANPFIGYKVTDRLVPGISVSYQYTRLRNWPFVGSTSTYNVFGIGPFVRYSIQNGFFAHAEYEFLRGRFETTPFPEYRHTEENLLIGGGYSNVIPGTRSGFYAQVLYVATWRGAAGNSIYSSPLIYRVGFSIF